MPFASLLLCCNIFLNAVLLCAWQTLRKVWCPQEFKAYLSAVLQLLFKFADLLGLLTHSGRHHSLAALQRLQVLTHRLQG